MSKKIGNCIICDCVITKLNLGSIDRGLITCDKCDDSEHICGSCGKLGKHCQKIYGEWVCNKCYYDIICNPEDEEQTIGSAYYGR